MVLTFPPIATNVDALGQKIPDFKDIGNSHILDSVKRDNKDFEGKDIPYEKIFDYTSPKPGEINDLYNQGLFYKNDIFSIPLNVILVNIANTIILIIMDIFNPNSYDNLYTFFNIFIKENRLLYLGIFNIVILFIVSFFELY